MKFGTSADEFGGYTDKSKGEFEGKSDPYDPINDLGGIGCRHFWSWISDELAFHLRPELEEIQRRNLNTSNDSKSKE